MEKTNYQNMPSNKIKFIDEKIEYPYSIISNAVVANHTLISLNSYPSQSLYSVIRVVAHQHKLNISFSGDYTIYYASGELEKALQLIAQSVTNN